MTTTLHWPVGRQTVPRSRSLEWSRYVSGGGFGGSGSAGVAGQIASWVERNFTATTVGNSTVYLTATGTG
jgi:hypothetical protein